MKIRFLGYELIFQRNLLEPVSRPLPRHPKPVKQKKPRIKKCPTMDKRMFTREQAAKERDQIKKPNIRIYCCEFCNTWHLTHKKVTYR